MIDYEHLYQQESALREANEDLLQQRIAALEAALENWHTLRCDSGAGCHLGCPCTCHDDEEEFREYRAESPEEP